jgi:hypothetical protein
VLSICITLLPYILFSHPTKVRETLHENDGWYRPAHGGGGLLLPRVIFCARKQGIRMSDESAFGKRNG